MRIERLQSCLHSLGPRISFRGLGQTRWLHKSRKQPEIPEPRPFIPDVHAFLTLIGRGLSKHSSKFPSWASLFTATSTELQELGIEPPRTRRYLIQWMQRYRKGAFGPGGDFSHVKDGEAMLKIAKPPAAEGRFTRWVVNVPHGAEGSEKLPDQLVRPQGYNVSGLRSIRGPHAQILQRQAGAIVKVTEGLWEQKRGRKIDGGERRRAEIRFKRRSAERRAEREAESGNK